MLLFNSFREREKVGIGEFVIIKARFSMFFEEKQAKPCFW